MNCTCAEGAMTEEMITDATIRLIEEEQMKKARKFKKVLNKTEKKKNKKNKKQEKEFPRLLKRPLVLQHIPHTNSNDLQ